MRQPSERPATCTGDRGPELPPPPRGPNAAAERSQQVTQVFGAAIAGIAQIALKARVRMEAVEGHRNVVCCPDRVARRTVGCPVRSSYRVTSARFTWSRA